jgi:hypothetical protein
MSRLSTSLFSRDVLPFALLLALLGAALTARRARGESGG